MTNTQLVVTDGLVINMHYTLRLEDGEMVDSSEGRAPLAFLQGYDQIVPGLEKAIAGMAVGDKKDVVVAAVDGYGERQPDSLQIVAKNTFPPEMQLRTGMRLHAQDSATGEVFQVFVSDIRDDDVVIDYNHPLAGKTLYFNVEITGLRKATEEEMDHGHVHGEGDHHH